jgi:hypothetical protein
MVRPRHRQGTALHQYRRWPSSVTRLSLAEAGCRGGAPWEHPRGTATRQGGAPRLRAAPVLHLAPWPSDKGARFRRRGIGNMPPCSQRAPTSDVL